MYRLATTTLRRLGVDAELMHEAGIIVLAGASRSNRALDYLYRNYYHEDPRLQTSAWGLVFPNPLGIAAGLDKNAQAFPGLLAMGFGHAELGTIVPLQQFGQTGRRIFVLHQDSGIINRMGFPSDGMVIVDGRIKLLKPKAHGVVGANVGPNKDSVAAGFERSLEDYVASALMVKDDVHFITINPSSPNTKDLRGQAHRLEEILTAVREAVGPDMAINAKFAPVTDIGWRLFDLYLEVLMRFGGGLVGPNTTLERPPGMRSRHRNQTGGLSGRSGQATKITIEYAYRATEGKIAIAATGLDDGPAVEALIRKGASLVQGYTQVVFGGPSIAGQAARHLSAVLDREGMDSINDLRGTDVVV